MAINKNRNSLPTLLSLFAPFVQMGILSAQEVSETVNEYRETGDSMCLMELLDDKEIPGALQSVAERIYEF